MRHRSCWLTAPLPCAGATLCPGWPPTTLCWCLVMYQPRACEDPPSQKRTSPPNPYPARLTSACQSSGAVQVTDIPVDQSCYSASRRSEAQRAVLSAPPTPCCPPWNSMCVYASQRCLYCYAVVQSPSRVRLFVTPWTAACQASLSLTISPCPLHW